MDHSQSLDLPLLSKPIRNDAHYIYYNNIAIFISTISFFYNIIEGAVSIYFGEVTDSLSLFFFGVQSIVEVLSSIIVLWKVMTSYTEDKNQIRKEKIATVFIGCLFIFLTIGIFITGILSLINHDYPTTTIPNIIVSSCATSIMLCLYFTKVKLAKELNSSTIQSDAQCSLACIRITVLLLLGSIVFHFWEGGWWIDGAIALILGVLFGKEGVSMLIWANSKDFSGGCCGGCAKMPESSKPTLTKVRCTTSLENGYQGVPNADQDIEAKVPLKQGASGGCCKAGKCSKKEGNPQSISNPQASLSTAIISNGVEDTSLKAESVLPKKAGGCCKSGVCSKKAQPAPVEANLSSAPKDFVSTGSKIEVIEDNPMPIKAAGGGCCKSGTCSKKAEVAQAQPQPTQIIVDIPIINEASGQSDSIRPEEPQKKTGGCCKGGKCSKKAENPESAPSENIPQAIVKEVDLAQNIINEQPSSEPAVLPIKAGGGCCKGGKCNKKEESLQTISTLADTSVATSSNIESEVIAVPQKTGGCCKNGVCTKKAQANVPELSEASQASVSSHDIQVPVTTSEDRVDIVVPPAGKGGCCKNGVCSKKTNNGQQNTGLNNNEEEIRLRTQGDSYSQEVVKEDIC